MHSFLLDMIVTKDGNNCVCAVIYSDTPSKYITKKKKKGRGGRGVYFVCDKKDTERRSFIKQLS